MMIMYYRNMVVGSFCRPVCGLVVLHISVLMPMPPSLPTYLSSSSVSFHNTLIRPLRAVLTELCHAMLCSV